MMKIGNYWTLTYFIIYLMPNAKGAQSRGRLSNMVPSPRISWTWSSWSSWSSCSRTCGGGVRVRARTCVIRRLQHGTEASKSCTGDTTEYDLCKKQSCGHTAEDFLAYQCSQHNGYIMEHRRIQQWVPYVNVKNPCEVQCYSLDQGFVQTFGKAIDGTTCPTSSTNGICINGRCTSVDCAGQLGTNSRTDICGVCRGDNSSCIHYMNTYWGHPRKHSVYRKQSDSHYNYITQIPKGATHLFIKEYSSSNYIALKEKHGKFLLNGNWKVDPPGSYKQEVEIIYSHTSYGQDTVSIQGPTSKDLIVYVLGTGDVPTVEYDYWISDIGKDVNVTKNHGALTSRYHERSIFTEARSKTDTTSYKENSVLKELYIPKSRGYKSFYHRNKIIPVLDFDKPSVHLAPLNNYNNSVPQIILKEIQPSSTNIPKIYTTSKGQYSINDRYRYEISQSEMLKKELEKKKLNNEHDKISPINEKGVLPYHKISEPKNQLTRRNSNRIKHVQLKSQKSINKSPKESKGTLSNSRKKRREKSEECSRCSKVKQQKRNFCLSDFVLRIVLISSDVEDQEVRYEVDVIQSYKNKMPILAKEYLWTRSLCKCPKLKTGVEYIIMGHLGSVMNKRESKLVVDNNSFVRRYNTKRAKVLQRLARDATFTCKKFS